MNALNNVLANPGARVIIAFLLSLVIIYVVAKMVGETNKEKWFKKRTKFTVFTRRGFLGETLHFGHPVTKEGYFVMIAMFSLIIAISYLIIFVI